MTETQISTITIKTEPLHEQGCECGGAYREVDVTVYVDKSLPAYQRKIALTHEVLGVYLGTLLDPEILSQIAEHIIDSLDQLEHQT